MILAETLCVSSDIALIKTLFSLPYLDNFRNAVIFKIRYEIEKKALQLMKKLVRSFLCNTFWEKLSKSTRSKQN